MPKKFTEKEKDWIQHKLLEEGRRRFAASGLRKTSVEDLTKACGIAQGSFYLFFASKEVLFYQLLLEEEQRIRVTLLESYLAEDVVAKESIKRFMLEAFRLLSESPLMKQMYLEGDFEQLVRKLPAEMLERNFAEDRDALMPVIRRWQASGLLAGTRPELIVGMLRSLLLLSLHKKEIGEAVFDETIALLIDLITEGMLANQDAGRG
ncbi:TetR/AcrR family transcriptional regulator [Paenibacillus sp. IB182493]|uniref:TetR/AcrR family transcriptional regulator n=1 Tax=Paenibacillus arenilitoris TaxID=2772299 RepID=A0A927CUG4_9BACL|nr:TetR/AcrR family transcriptional regulator [Paenibacillus arenilitoris]MBD2871780.1 TetR/AcrR family transcriptional regulator [Paenibacillus arenilitoris]